MLIGHEKLAEIFKALAKSDRLSQGYIFFGEPQVGKFSFALALANFLENKAYEPPEKGLTETMVLKPSEEGSIGIDEIRGLQHFLSQKPVYSGKRVAIIDEAEALTPQAQNAILKTAEEPPPQTLIILALATPEALLPTLQSRFIKIYFSRVGLGLIKKMLVKKFEASEKEAEIAASSSFGRPGRAIDLLENKEVQAVRKKALALLSRRQNKKEIIESLTEDPSAISPLFYELVAELAKDPVKNYHTLGLITERLAKMKQFSTNRRLQLNLALWNI